MATSMSRNEAVKLYTDLQQLDLDRMSSIKSADLAKELSGLSGQVRNLSGQEKEVAPAMILAAKVAKHCSQEDFCTFLTNGELPPIKLSKQEMQMLQGGGFLGKLLIGVGVVGVVAGAVLLSRNKSSGTPVANPIGFGGDSKQQDIKNEFLKANGIGPNEPKQEFKVVREYGMWFKKVPVEPKN